MIGKKIKEKDVYLSPIDAMKQVSITGHIYFEEALKILQKQKNSWSISDAIELAKILAQDFHTVMLCTKMQEIRDAILNND